MPTSTGAAFAARVCAAFGLAAGETTLRPLAANSTRLWELQVDRARFAVKEFAYQHQEPGRTARLAAAAAFEYSVWRACTVVMPEPVPAADGALISSLKGSRGRVVPVRVHRWLDGQAVPVPPDERTAAAAGQVLAAIQRYSLLANGQIAVLDWDECGHCHPRLEAVESALRWAGVSDGEPEPTAFRAFLRGYQLASGELTDLGPADFAKWVAALAGWVGFTGSRALGEYDDTAAEQETAAGMAVSTLDALARTLESLDRWATFAA